MIFYGKYDHAIYRRRVRDRSLTKKDLSIHHAKEVTQSTGAVKWRKGRGGYRWARTDSQGPGGTCDGDYGVHEQQGR